MKKLLKGIVFPALVILHIGIRFLYPDAKLETTNSGVVNQFELTESENSKAKSTEDKPRFIEAKAAKNETTQITPPKLERISFD